MKKILLAAMGLTALQMNAGVDPASYDAANGLTCTNLWEVSRNISVDEWNKSPLAEFSNKTRSMVVVDNQVIVAQSKTVVVDETTSNEYATLLFFDIQTGEYLKSVQVTVGGQPINALLCANQVGVDDFGNVWMCGLVSNTETKPFTIYHIKDLNTGEAEVAAELSVPADEAEAWGRHDYYDLVGDVTGVQAGTVFMTPVANGASPFVVGFEREQGSSEWHGKMDDGEYYVLTVEETYPADQTTWNGAPMVRITRDEEHSGEVFYIDAFVTAPTLYNTAGTMIDSFAANADLCPKVGPNGCVEFSMNGKTYFAYTLADYDTEPGSQINFCEYGDDLTFESLTKLWSIPAGGFGTISDTGTRMFGIVPSVYTDENGVQGAYLSLFKCNNGIGVYKIAPAEWNDPNAGVQAVSVDTVEGATEYFNLMGQRVDNPTPGTLVIKRQGNKAEKYIVK